MADLDFYGGALALNLDTLLLAAQRGEPINIIYHHPCPDGFGAAYAAWTRLGDKARYIPYNHDDTPELANIKGSYVAMCDCCYKRQALVRARLASRDMIVLDHHKSSMDENSDLDFCHFDMEKSGAGLAWDFFQPGIKRPLLIDSVEDRDLHRYALPNTGAFCSKLDSLPIEFEVWDQVSKIDGDELSRFLREGSEMLAQFESQAQAIISTAMACMFFGKRAYILNAPYRFASRCGAILCERPGCEMVVVWNSADLQIAKLSLRSYPGSPCDVSVMAVSLGGGGHAGASGASLALSHLATLAQASDWDCHVENP